MGIKISSTILKRVLVYLFYSKYIFDKISNNSDTLGPL